MSDKDAARNDIDVQRLASAKRLYSHVHTNLIIISSKPHTDIEEIRELSKDIENVPPLIREYEKEKNALVLDRALDTAMRAFLKLQALSPPATGDMRELITGMHAGLLGGGFWAGLIWLILHVVLGLAQSEVVYYVDLFFFAVFGALASSAIYLGEKALRESSTKILVKVTTSPLLAVVLIILLSELSIGVGSELSSTGASSNLGSFTLRDASDMMKLAFGFLFAFFSETTVELLKRIVRQPTKQ